MTRAEAEEFVEYLQSIKVSFLHDFTVEDVEPFSDRSAAYRAMIGVARINGPIKPL
jgi:hypothetical protein